MTITYTEKGAGLHQRIADAGFFLSEVDGAWIADDPVAVQALIDGYTLADCAAWQCAAVDAHATRLRDAAVAGVSPAEMASWSIKRAEAAAWNARANDADAPTLSLEAHARGVPTSAVVARVAAAAAALAELEALIAGVAGRHKDALRAQPDYIGVLGYDWHQGWPV